MAKTWLRLLAAIAVLSLIAAACGDDDDTSAGDEPAEESAEEPSDEPADEPTGQPAGEGLATEGEVEVASGVTLDLSQCPDDWSPTQGVDGDEIRLGISLPRSGTLASFGPIADGMQAYFDYVNANDPIDGKEIVLVIRDDAYEAGRTVANVQEMLETDDLFAFTFIIGSANNGAVRPTFDEACVPQLFNATGLPAWGDPVNWPWTIGGLLAYNTEATLWCEDIVAEVGEGVTVAGLFANNDFGAAYQQGLEGCADEGLIELVANEVHEQGAPDITNEMTNMIASDADVFILGSTGAFCPQSVAGVAQSGWRPAFYMSNTCNNLAAFFEPVKDAVALLAAEGSAVRMTLNNKDFTDPGFADDEAIQLGKQILDDAGLSADAGSESTGIIFANTVEQTLRGALELGELNRVTLIASTWNLNDTNPYLLDGINTITDGANDAYTIEGSVISQVVVQDDELTFEAISDLISVEGQTGVFGG